MMSSQPQRPAMFAFPPSQRKPQQAEMLAMLVQSSDLKLQKRQYDIVHAGCQHLLRKSYHQLMTLPFSYRPAQAGRNFLWWKTMRLVLRCVWKEGAQPWGTYLGRIGWIQIGCMNVLCMSQVFRLDFVLPSFRLQILLRKDPSHQSIGGSYEIRAISWNRKLAKPQNKPTLNDFSSQGKM